MTLRARIRSVVDFVLAHLGRSSAQLEMARRYSLRSDDRDSVDRAIYWAERATRRCGVHAGLLLGSLCLTRNAVGDARRAFDAFKTAAALGNPAGMQALGWCFEQGVGVEKDFALANRWYFAAADAGSSDCQIFVAKLLLKDWEVRGALARARHYAKLALAGGASEGRALLVEIDRKDGDSRRSTIEPSP